MPGYCKAMREKGVVQIRQRHRMLWSKKSQHSTVSDAKKGSSWVNNSFWVFDESYFVDSVTGGFCFPQYSYTGEQLVEIDDTTDYQSYFWGEDNLTPKEMSNYGITDFERDLSGLENYDLEIKIDTLEDFIRKIPDDFFRSYPKLIQYRDHFTKLVFKFGSGDAWFGSYNEEFRKTLMEYGLSCKYEPYMKGTIEWGYLVKKVCSLYVYHLKSNLERLHPLYIPKILGILNDSFEEENLWYDYDLESFARAYHEQTWMGILPPLITKEIESKYWLHYRKKL